MKCKRILSVLVAAIVLIGLLTGCTTAEGALANARKSLLSGNYVAATNSAINSIKKAAKSKKVDVSEPAMLLKEIMEAAEADYLGRISNIEGQEDSVEKYDSIISFYNAIIEIQNIIIEKEMTNPAAGVSVAINDYNEAIYAAYSKRVGQSYLRGKSLLATGDYANVEASISYFKYVLESPYAADYPDTRQLYDKAYVIYLTPIYEEGKALVLKNTIEAARIAVDKLAAVNDSSVASYFNDIDRLYAKASDLANYDILLIIARDNEDLATGLASQIERMEDRWTSVKLCLATDQGLGHLMALGDYIDWCDSHYATDYIQQEMPGKADLLTNKGIRKIGEDWGMDLVIYLDVDYIQRPGIQETSRNNIATTITVGTPHAVSVNLRTSVNRIFVDDGYAFKIWDATSPNYLATSNSSPRIEVSDTFYWGTYTTSAGSTSANLVNMITEVNPACIPSGARDWSGSGFLNGYMYCSLWDEARKAALQGQINGYKAEWLASSENYLMNELESEFNEMIMDQIAKVKATAFSREM